MTAGVAEFGNLIGPAFAEADRTFLDLNPAAKGDVVGRFPLSGPEDVAAAVEAAERAFVTWRRESPVTRGKTLLKLAAALRERFDAIAAAITREQGKPLAESRGELGKAIDYLDYYGVLAYEYGGRTLPSARPGVEISLQPEPLGVVALITPWNIPIAGPLRKLAPALVAGNCVVIKPSEETPLSCQFVAEAAVAAGLPPGVINVVHGDGAGAGAALAADRRVRAISFTGSTAVGRTLARVGAERLVRVQLELGGKNASIVLDDCDLELAVSQILPAAFGGSGQQCTATSRILVHRAVRDRFTELLVERVRALRIGPGTDPEATIGPLVSERQLVKTLEYVEIGRAEGAELLTGGERLSGDELDDGWFVAPTVFGSATPAMRIVREEIFGPVLALVTVDDDDEALAIANETEYGLSAAVYTRSLGRAQRFVQELEVGAVAVNLPSAGWELNTAFGGTKASGGYGWKEQGVEAFDFFSELKAVQTQAG